MKILTTVYIKTELLEKVTKAADILKIPKNKLVVLLLENAMKKYNVNDACMFSSVKYQKSSPDIIWKRFHVVMEHDVYEKCLDMRKLFKSSVSYILALSIHEFLYTMIAEISSKDYKDNYNHNYIFIRNYHEGFFNFSIFWEFQGIKTLKKFLM